MFGIKSTLDNPSSETERTNEMSLKQNGDFDAQASYVQVNRMSIDSRK